MHERSQKNSHLDTVLYEIDMLRHCALTLPGKREYFEASGCAPARAEYNLGIEGFLIHLRNVLAFFTSRQEKDSDLLINRPQRWAGREIAQREYSDLIKRAKEIDREHGVDESTCYDQISKYLQHCTTFRYERAKNWNIEKLFADINSVLEEFEVRFGSGADAHGIMAGTPANNVDFSTVRRREVVTVEIKSH